MIDPLTGLEDDGPDGPDKKKKAGPPLLADTVTGRADATRAPSGDPFAALDGPDTAAIDDPFAGLDADPFGALDGPEKPHRSIGGSVKHAAEMVGHIVTHPWELPAAVVTDAMTALAPAPLKPGAVPMPRVSVGDAPFAARSDATYIPDPSGRRSDKAVKDRAVLNTAVNALLPFLPAASLPAKLAIGAGAGAFYARDDDPIAGALAGLTLGGVSHGAEKVVQRVRGGPTEAPTATPPTEPGTPAAEAPEATTYQGPPVPEAVAPERPRRGTVDALQKALLPASRGPEAAQAAHVIRAANAQRARDVVVGEQSRAHFAQEIGTLPIKGQLAIDRAIEGGTSIPEHAEAIKTIRRDLDAERDAIRDLGTGALDTYRENYLPHIWKDPAAAAALLSGEQQPLVGSPGFLKQRKIETLQQGIDLGLEPVSYNPVDLANIRLREMRRYRMQLEIRHELAEKGLHPETIEPVKRVLDNFLSPGLRGNAIYDAYMSVGGMLNQVQLGLSAFHLGFTTAEQVISQNALAVGALAEGKMGKATSLALTSPLAPVRQYMKGSKMLREYTRPGSIGGPMTEMVDALVQGGGRVKSEFNTANLQKFHQARNRGDIPQMTLRAIPALIEASAKPVMEHVVPRQKLGVFYDLAQRELERLPPGATPEQVREVMGAAWDRVDGRLGSVVYDNLFWNKVLKDLMHASVRSVGWNWGTWRELGGGTFDFAREVRNLAGGKPAKMTARMEYLTALPITVGITGALFNYLYTGEAPKELKDYFHPRNGRIDADGNPERLRLPTYVRDVDSYFRHPIRTAGYKANPLLTAVIDAIDNEDFFGHMIRDPNDPAFDQFRDLATFAADQLEPFTIKNARVQSKRTGQPFAEAAALNAIGVTPATAEERRTPAQNLMAETLAKRLPKGRTPKERRDADARRDARTEARRGEWDAMLQAVEQGVMRPRDLLTEGRRQAAGQPSLVTRFRMLSLDEAERVYAKGTPEEQRVWLYPLTLKRIAAKRPR